MVSGSFPSHFPPIYLPFISHLPPIYLPGTNSERIVISMIDSRLRKILKIRWICAVASYSFCASSMFLVPASYMYRICASGGGNGTCNMGRYSRLAGINNTMQLKSTHIVRMRRPAILAREIRYGQQPLHLALGDQAGVLRTQLRNWGQSRPQIGSFFLIV